MTKTDTVPSRTGLVRELSCVADQHPDFDSANEHSNHLDCTASVFVQVAWNSPGKKSLRQAAATTRSLDSTSIGAYFEATKTVP